jgi:tetratricopeptide (TPR) repeat protein
MSLLNDALRKKRSEQQQADGPLKASLPKLSVKNDDTKRKPIRIAVAGVLAVALVSCGAWLYWLASDRPVETKRSISSAATATQAEDTTLIETIGKPISATAADAATPRPTPAADTTGAVAPATPAPLRQAASAKQTPVAKPSSVKPKSLPKAKAAHQPVKPKAVSQPQPKPPKQPRPKVQRQRAAKPNDAQRHLQSKRLYQKARQYHRRDRLEQAIALYQEVIKIDPEHYNARFNLGAAYIETESFDNAYYILTDLYLKEPDNQQVMLNLAIANIGRRRFDQALALLDKAAATPKAPLFEIALHKGIAYNHLNQTQDALDWYKRAEALRPDDPRLLFNLAVVSDQQQRYAAAIDYYRRHIDQSPGMNVAKEKQIRRRIRALQAYHTQPNPEESIPQ